jgi:drug/metabolite transporter (DMT)-like permease
MPTDKFKNQLHLHFIVFIWGFTAILAALISVDAMSLVWYRVLIASMTILVFLKIKKVAFNESKADIFKLFIGGILIALHWTTFFHAIKISTISTTLITMSSGALFVVMLQPILGKKKFSIFEMILAIITIIGFIIIFRIEKLYTEGIIYALISSFILAIFSIYNSKLIQNYKGSKIAFYELFFAFIFMSIVLFINDSFNDSFFNLNQRDWIYLLVLATICTAYPFVIAAKLLKKMSPFTMVLTNNLEPVYGIILAVLVFGNKEKMSYQFYIGAILIVSSVLLNGIIKNKLRFKK